jgi:hypothetical protein
MQRSDDGGARWWDDANQNGIPDADEDQQTRAADHPDGFSFLMPHPDPFWNTWLSFTPQELSRLRFLRWRYQTRQLSEWPSEEKVAA